MLNREPWENLILVHKDRDGRGGHELYFEIQVGYGFRGTLRE